jgi:hypothetical protein
MSKTAKSIGELPAFPLSLGNQNLMPDFGGLTKREWLAGMAMQAVLSNPIDLRPEQVVSFSISYADQLLAELAK